MEFSEKVKQIRSKLKLSQMALARELGSAFSTVNRWEQGKFKPSYDAQKKFEKFIDRNKVN